jgi:DNA-binding transcriptional LysR family regulator
MEIYQLKAFLAVARVGHLTRAADQLHITQPAVSKQIKALEEELGVLLFDRLPTGMSALCLMRWSCSIRPSACKAKWRA